MKGIILAGGKATRLYPITKGISKQLLPIYDKPMIYYPLSVLMLAGIQEILIISTPADLGHFENLLGNGGEWGISISYQQQPSPDGIAQAFILAENFIRNDKVCLILGDNIFYGDRLPQILREASTSKKGASIVIYSVKNPQRYGVVHFNQNKEPVKIIEKPTHPKSNWVVTGIYFFDHEVATIAKSLKPSARGELEITDIINTYIKKKNCETFFLGRGNAWLDTGTYDSLLDASFFIKIIEERQGLKIGCPEEVAYRQKFISSKQLLQLAKEYQTNYREYLEQVTTL